MCHWQDYGSNYFLLRNAYFRVTLKAISQREKMF